MYISAPVRSCLCFLPTGFDFHPSVVSYLYSIFSLSSSRISACVPFALYVPSCTRAPHWPLTYIQAESLAPLTLQNTPENNITRRIRRRSISKPCLRYADPSAGDQLGDLT